MRYHPPVSGILPGSFLKGSNKEKVEQRTEEKQRQKEEYFNIIKEI